MVETPHLILILQQVVAAVAPRVILEILRVTENRVGLAAPAVVEVQPLKLEDQEMLVVIVLWRVTLEEPLQDQTLVQVVVARQRLGRMLLEIEAQTVVMELQTL